MKKIDAIFAPVIFTQFKHVGTRWSVSVNHVAFLISIIFVVFYNQFFWQQLWITVNPSSIRSLLFVSSVGILFCALTALVCSLMALPYIFKPVITLFFFGAAATAYFMKTYGVVIDSVMIQNMAETDFAEAESLFNVKLLVYILLLGVAPGIILFRVHLHYQSPTRELLTKLKVIVGCLLISVVVILSFSSEYASFFRNNKSVRQTANPLNFIYGGIYFLGQETSMKALEKLGVDAHLAIASSPNAKPVLLVFVVGETARADHFGLNGYERDTTPLLSQQNIINFPHVYSCGTSTAVSVPCMFSDMTRATYDSKKAKHRETLLDVIKHSGMAVLWRDNNSGCKGVCDRVDNEQVSTWDIPDLCITKDCYDEILLRGLEKKLSSNPSGQVIFLHQKGSHGPEYYLRYPKHMTYYTPVCETNQLQDCSDQSLINGYDNSIRYTDYFLNQTINWLKEQSEVYDTVMIYVSDHGESLGEHQLYLHGMPYAISPDAQKHVPFFVWFSDAFQNNRGVNQGCVHNIANQEFSHDNIFSSILGLLNINTSVYKRDEDMFQSCYQ